MLGSVVVGVQIVRRSGLQVFRAGKLGLFDNLADTPIKAPHHPIGLRMPGLRGGARCPAPCIAD